MSPTYDGSERRNHNRYIKNYSLVYYYIDSVDKYRETTYIKDISKSGLRFTSSEPIKLGTRLRFEIGIPFIAPNKLILEGSVIACKEITPRLVYEVRAQFLPMEPLVLQLFESFEKQFVKDHKSYGLH